MLLLAQHGRHTRRLDVVLAAGIHSKRIAIQISGPSQCAEVRWEGGWRFALETLIPWPRDQSFVPPQLVPVGGVSPIVSCAR